MSKIEQKYRQLASKPSDINEHFWTLRRHAEGCEHVVEMGVRYCVSTWALLAGHPKHLTSIDLADLGTTKEAEDAAAAAGIDFQFIRADSLEIEIDSCDVLFIDTWHAYAQLIRELRRHARNVRGFILLHDTTTYAFHDEPIAAAVSKSPPSDAKRGLMPAIRDFLNESLEWRLHEQFTNNNGLTILKRIKK